MHPYPLDGAGKSIKLFAGTYVGQHNGHAVRWQIEVISGYAYATRVWPGTDRECMIAEPYENPPNGLFFVYGRPRDYSSQNVYRLFAVDAMPVLALERGGLIVKTTDGERTIDHLMRVSSRPDHLDMYDLKDGARESCLPAHS